MAQEDRLSKKKNMLASLSKKERDQEKKKMNIWHILMQDEEKAGKRACDVSNFFTE